jgi:hypothetical protein
MSMQRTQGLNCPNCGGVVPVPEGVRVVQCPFCEQRSLVQGERGVRRWQVCCRISRQQAVESVESFYSGVNKAIDLKRTARLEELFLVYLPYWRVSTKLAGYLFGRVRSGDDKTKPAEVEVMEEMHWNDAAVDVSEFGVHRVSLSLGDLEPYDADRLQAEAMVFEPTESRTDALAEAEAYFVQRARDKKQLKRTYFEKYHLLDTQISLVYFPLWVARYAHRNRVYQVVVDGAGGRVLYGKAPGNIIYRAAALVGAMAAGTFFMVNGTILAARFLTDNGDDAGLIILLPAAVGVALITAGYRAFRYGEEVEEIQEGAKKAMLTRRRRGLMGHFQTGLRIYEELSEMTK